MKLYKDDVKDIKSWIHSAIVWNMCLAAYILGCALSILVLKSKTTVTSFSVNAIFIIFYAIKAIWPIYKLKDLIEEREIF